MSMIYIMMGVSSSGKTLIGQMLADILELPFYDGDDFHPAENLEKMKNGQPLNDSDRLPWLQALRRNMVQWEQNGGAVLACSALKKSYRNILSPPEIDVQFIFLKGSQTVIKKRMQQRKNHFMPPELLDSQFDALEEPQQAITVQINQKPGQILEEIIRRL